MVFRISERDEVEVFIAFFPDGGRFRGLSNPGNGCRFFL